MKMTVLIDCRRCGHTNSPDAKICAACHQPLDAGIRSAMSCPICGSANGAGAVTCVVCGYNLERVELIPDDQRTLLCPYCQTANPPPVESDAAAYCICCGREIRLPGSGYSLAEFTPDPAVCPACGKPGTPVGSIHGRHDSALAELLRPPEVPAVIRQEGMSSTEPPGHYHVEEDTGDDANVVERIWDSEVAAVRSILGVPVAGAGSTKRLATTRYRNALELWQNAYYCDTDKIVFARRLHSVRTWSPQDFAEEMRKEIPSGAS